MGVGWSGGNGDRDVMEEEERGGEGGFGRGGGWRGDDLVVAAPSAG